MNRIAHFANRHSSLLALVLLAGTALSPAITPALADDGLGGPKVKDESVQGQPRKLAGTPGGREAARDGAQRVPHRGFLRALLSLQKDDAPAGLRLTDAQLATIRQTNEAFVDSVQTYISTNKATIEQLRSQLPAPERRRVDGFLRMGEDIASLRDLSAVTDAANAGKGAEQARPERKPEGGKDAEQAIDEAKAREAREQLRTIVEGAPKPADAHAAIVAVLTEEQRAYVKQQGEKLREQGREGQGRMEGRGEGDGKGRGEGRGEGPRLTEEQREKLRNMTPEERREFLRKVREERGNKPAKGPKGEEKPKSDDDMMDPR